MLTKKRIAILTSGGGTNLQSLIDAVESGEVPGEIVLVISNKEKAYALERAARHRIPAETILYQDFSSLDDFTRAIMERLKSKRVDLVCLAGFTRILSPFIYEEYTNKLLNVHPSLLPAFGGKGMYGLRVHRAVLESGTKFTGATVHIVTPETDIGPIVCQEVIAVLDDDTPETLAQRVLLVEHRIYPQALKLMVEESIEIKGLRVRIRRPPQF